MEAAGGNIPVFYSYAVSESRSQNLNLLTGARIPQVMPLPYNGKKKALYSMV
jgi:hypothetical protein